jgi:hypothetical protein
MVCAFYKTIETDEGNVVVVSWRGHRQALPGGSIAIGDLLHDFPSEGLGIESLSKEDQLMVWASLKRDAVDYNWTWWDKPDRTIELLPSVWIGNDWRVAQMVKASA